MFTSTLDAKLAFLPRFLGEKQAIDQPGILCWSGLTLPEAETTLDWLEANGYQQTRLEYQEGKAFTVRALAASRSCPAPRTALASSPSTREERRANPRSPVRRALYCDLLAAVGDAAVPARVDDLSSTGISLLLKERFEPGTLLPVRVENETWHLVYRRTLRVVHVTPQTDGFHILGGEFTTRLSAHELRGLLW